MLKHRHLVSKVLQVSNEKRFRKHTHFGGEEILVLSGEFIDEHGKYPHGTWIRSPHMSVHNPYVEEETIIIVKTGHLNFEPHRIIASTSNDFAS